MTIHKLFHSWLKKYGGYFAQHEEEICSDILEFAHNLDAKLRENYPKNLRFAKKEGVKEGMKMGARR